MATPVPHTQLAVVPFLDLRPSHEPLKAELLADIADLLDTGAFTNGPQVRAFETAFASFCGTSHCVGVGSGLDALRLGQQACGLEAGDEVGKREGAYPVTEALAHECLSLPITPGITEEELEIVSASVGNYFARG